MDTVDVIDGDVQTAQPVNLVNNLNCQQPQLSTTSTVNNLNCQQPQLSTTSAVNPVNTVQKPTLPPRREIVRRQNNGFCASGALPA
jgi:hypothetical protein